MGVIILFLFVLILGHEQNINALLSIKTYHNNIEQQ